MRVVVVGRGVFGLSAALALARGGHQVVVVGQRDPSASSEDISRIIRNDYPDAFHREWASEAIEAWNRWDPDGRRGLFHRSGLANLALQPLDGDGFVASSFVGLPTAAGWTASPSPNSSPS
ncbi:MAG: FAD-dependent oxidoreductase [Acidimicrobiia bacterium]